MCGIAGVVPFQPVPTQVAARMVASLAPRGPDGAGWLLAGKHLVATGTEFPDGAWTDPFLLHTRLAILDLSDAAHQPMSSADGRFHLVYNGEVYNFKELRRELEDLGHVFVTQGDTEVVLAAYRQWGTAMLDRFIGMFAIAILDQTQGRLFLARDRFGIKPLFYAQGDWGFAFASDLPTLLTIPQIPREADPERVYRYLTMTTGSEPIAHRSMFRHVLQVPAAHWMEVDLEKRTASTPVRYWDIDLDLVRRVPYDEAVREVRSRFLDSVRLHLRSDVPLGAAMSGGVDSSAVVAAMRHHMGPERSLRTFTFLAENEALNEERWARIAGAAHGAIGHGVRAADPEALVTELPRLIAAQGEPFGSTSIYAQFRVFETARASGIKVMLDGQGADEMLAGYRTYYPSHLASLIRRGRLLKALRVYRAMVRQPGTKRRSLQIETAALVVPPGLLLAVRRRLQADRDHGGWLQTGWFVRNGVEPIARTNPVHRRGLRGTLQDSLTEKSLPHLLRYEDRNSMAHSIESRVPFLDHRLVEYIFSLPEDYLLAPDATSKAVFRDAMRGLVPDEVLDRRDKIGFETTEGDWMVRLDPWVRATLTSDTAARLPFLRTDRILAEWEAMRAGKVPYHNRVWRWVNLIEWTRLMEVDYDAAPREGTVAPATLTEQAPQNAPALQHGALAEHLHGLPMGDGRDVAPVADQASTVETS